MKKSLLTILFTCAAITPAIADGGALSGKWQFHLSVAGNESDQTCSFTQEGADLSGTCASGSATGQISGKVEDKKVSWTYKSQYDGSPLTVRYTGTLDSNKIAGTVNVEEYGVSGEFSGTQSK